MRFGQHVDGAEHDVNGDDVDALDVAQPLRGADDHIIGGLAGDAEIAFRGPELPIGEGGKAKREDEAGGETPRKHVSPSCCRPSAVPNEPCRSGPAVSRP